MLVILAPIALALAMPHAELGASAAEQRATDPSSAARLVEHAPAGTGISYAHIMAAQHSPQPGVQPGTPVRLIGFVMHRPGTPRPLFQVARFYITCCVADATVVYATVSPPATPPARNTWIDVTGTLARRNGELIVTATTITPIEQPAQPYLSASDTTTALAPAGDGTQAPRPKPPAPYRPPPTPKPDPAQHTFAANTTTIQGITLTVRKVELAKSETRVFTSVTNNSKAELTIFASTSEIGSTTRAESRGKAFTPVPGRGTYPRLLPALEPGETTSGVITFPPMSPSSPLLVVVSALSTDARLGTHGNLELGLAWDARGDPTS
jgi:hypothetical protein